MRFAEQWSWCTVETIRDATPSIREFRLRPDNGQVPPCPPGSHIGVAMLIAVVLVDWPAVIDKVRGWFAARRGQPAPPSIRPSAVPPVTPGETKT